MKVTLINGIFYPKYLSLQVSELLYVKYVKITDGF